MVTSRIGALTFDCHEPEAVADFWCVALGYEQYDADDTGVAIRDPSGGGSEMLFLIVPEAKSAKNRIHLDLVPPSSMQDEVERLEAAGATVERFVEENGSYWTIMLDPGGNEFCVLRGDAERKAPAGDA